MEILNKDIEKKESDPKWKEERMDTVSNIKC